MGDEDRRQPARRQIGSAWHPPGAAEAKSRAVSGDRPPTPARLGGRFRGRGPDRDFDPRPLRTALFPLLQEIAELPTQRVEPLTAELLDPLLRRHPKPGGGYFSRSELIAGYRAFAGEPGLDLDEARFRRRVQRRPVRSQSGVTPLTVLTQPFPCPGQCIFCPNDVRMPKSYLSDEPGAQRAAQNRFDPYLQTWNRLAAFDATGHPIDKIELIVLGGTWSFYPEAYQIRFVERCLDAMSDFGAGIDRRGECEGSLPDFETIDADVDGAAFSKNPYNLRVTEFLKQGRDGATAVSVDACDWTTLATAQRRNEAAGARCVGLVLETRPDHVTPEEVMRLRRLGATKVQLGVQSLDDEILAANRRGHDVEATRRAFALLRQAGFKIHAHWMANLLGASPASDLEDFDLLFADPDFRPDELKLYPCSLIETAELMRHWKSGAWKPYTDAELLSVVAGALAGVPRWCRVTRVIRDISSDDIVAGNKRTNFRQIAEAEVTRREGRIHEIRAREIRGEDFDTESLRLVETAYDASGIREVFLELVTGGDRIVGFLRLALPRVRSFLPELGSNAIVRELHVYGGAVRIGAEAGRRAQHRGLGSRLLDAAATRAEAEGHETLSVISAIGTRDYYRRQGFVDGDLYQHRPLGAPADSGAST